MNIMHQYASDIKRNPITQLVQHSECDALNVCEIGPIGESSCPFILSGAGTHYTQVSPRGIELTLFSKIQERAFQLSLNFLKWILST